MDNIGQGYAIIERPDSIGDMTIVVYGDSISEMTVPAPMDTMMVDTMIVDSMVYAGSLLAGFQLQPTPNPAREKLNIQFPLDSENNAWSIIDVSGKTMANGSCPFCQEATLEVQSLESGIYFIQLDSDGTQLSEKVMIGF